MTSFFAALEENREDDLDLPAHLQRLEVDAVRVRSHDLLKDREEDDEEASVPGIARHPDVEALFEGDSVQRVAEGISAAPAPEVAATEFVEAYRDRFHQVAAGDPAGLERVVQTFVDAFFRLDHNYRTPVFEAIVALRGEGPFQNFLDQLSTDELVDLAGQVDNAALPLLIEYARVVTEMQGRDPGLVSKVMGEERGADVRGAVAGTVGVHLAKFLTGDSADTASVEIVAAEVAALDQAPRQGWPLLNDLLTIEHRDDRQMRLLRIWGARLGGAIRRRAFSEALQWLQVPRGIDLDSRLLDEAYEQVATDEIFEILTEGGSDDRAVGDELLEDLSRHAGSRVLERLATEEDPGRRRILIDIVAEMARVDIRTVLPGLNDPRWYVVRNLTIALGKGGRKAAGEPLARAARHADHRVRIEALRALLPCLGDASAAHLVAALADDHPRVRSAAAYLLATLEDEAVVPVLCSAVGDEAAPAEARIAMIDALGKRSDDAARDMLQRFAHKRSRFSPSARALRTAARDALRSGNV